MAKWTRNERLALRHGIGIGFAIASGIVGELRRENPWVIASMLEVVAMNDRFVETLARETEADAASKGHPSAQRWTEIVRRVIALIPDDVRRGLKVVKTQEVPRG